MGCFVQRSKVKGLDPGGTMTALAPIADEANDEVSKAIDEEAALKDEFAMEETFDPWIGTRGLIVLPIRHG